MSLPNKTETVLQKYIVQISTAVILALLIWVGTTLSALTTSVVEIRTSLQGLNVLMSQQISELSRRVGSLETWKEQRQLEIYNDKLYRK